MKKKIIKKKTAAKKSARRVIRKGRTVVTNKSKLPYENTQEAETSIPVDNLPEHVAYVEVSGGLTKKLAEFEYARLDVSVRMPCAPTEDGIADAYAEVSDMVSRYLESEASSAGV